MNDLTTSELEILRASALNMGGDGAIVRAVVNGCAFACCGRGWHRRDGYWQEYQGYIDNLQLPDNGAAGTFMLYSPGIGTLSYVIAVRFGEVESVDPR